jgi:hypothetical protein
MLFFGPRNIISKKNSIFVKYGGYHFNYELYCNERDSAISNQSDFRFYLYTIKIFDLMARWYEIIYWYYIVRTTRKMSLFKKFLPLNVLLIKDQGSR